MTWPVNATPSCSKFKLRFVFELVYYYELKTYFQLCSTISEGLISCSVVLCYS